MAKQTNSTFTSKAVTCSTLSEDENSSISNAKRIKFEDDDEEKFVSYFDNTRNQRHLENRFKFNFYLCFRRWKQLYQNY